MTLNATWYHWKWLYRPFISRQLNFQDNGLDAVVRLSVMKWCIQHKFAWKCHLDHVVENGAWRHLKKAISQPLNGVEWQGSPTCHSGFSLKNPVYCQASIRRIHSVSANWYYSTKYPKSKTSRTFIDSIKIERNTFSLLFHTDADFCDLPKL